MEFDNASCGPIEHQVSYNRARFALVCYLGTPLALIGMINNGLLLLLFAQPRFRNSPTLYLCFLALLDIAICSIYVPFFTVDALAIYLQALPLHHLWHSYVMLLFCTSRVVQLASTYMVVCATVERFVLVAEISCLKGLSSSGGRWVAILAVLGSSLALRMPAYWEYRVDHIQQCPSFRDYIFVDLLANRQDYFIYNFYVIQIIHVLIPFVFLLLLNLLIALFMYWKLRRQTDIALIQATVGPMWRSTVAYTASRTRLKYATWTMVAIVFSYLACNTLSVVVTVLERFASGSPVLYGQDGLPTLFYTYSADMISIMVVFNSFVRIFIYAGCNPEIRRDIRNLVCCQFGRKSSAAHKFQMPSMNKEICKEHNEKTDQLIESKRDSSRLETDQPKCNTSKMESVYWEEDTCRNGSIKTETGRRENVRSDRHSPQTIEMLFHT